MKVNNIAALWFYILEIYLHLFLRSWTGLPWTQQVPLLKIVFDNVDVNNVNNGKLPHVLHLTVHLDKKGYLGFLSEPCTPIQTL